MSVIELKNVHKVYGSGDSAVHAINNLSLEINQGNMLAIMGTSGSGKSTLLNMIGTIDELTEGTYMIDGKAVQEYTQKEKAALRNKMFGFVMQDFGLIPHYTVEKNVQLPLQYVKCKKSVKREKSDKLLERVGLGNKKKVYPTQLSGGQKQRVAITRALINDAEILLCDEPTGALDSKTTREIMELFVELNKAGKTVIIVTHDKEVASYCDRIISLEDGEIVRDEINPKK